MDLNVWWVMWYATCGSFSLLAEGLTQDGWLQVAINLGVRYDSDYNHHNLTDIALIHTEDAIIMPPGYPAVTGIEEYKEALKEQRTAETFDSANQTSNEIVFNTDTFAVVKYSFQYKVSPDASIQHGKGVYLLRMVSGKPLMELDIWN